jgi:hypothetical protein
MENDKLINGSGDMLDKVLSILGNLSSDEAGKPKIEWRLGKEVEIKKHFQYEEERGLWLIEFRFKLVRYSSERIATSVVVDCLYVFSPRQVRRDMAEVALEECECVK